MGQFRCVELVME